MTSTVIATRGERLALSRVRFSGRDQRPEAFHAEVLGIVEIDADERIAARVVFDPDDIDAAFEELDARYLAGEAAAHAHTWSVIARAYAAFNRRELPATTPDWVNIDHRRATAFAPGDLTAYIRATWDLAPDLSDLHRGRASAERPRSGRHPCGAWDLARGLRRRVAGGQSDLTVEGDLINRCELFDEADLDAALARFDELSRPAPRLENAASQVYERFWTYFAARDWDAMAEMLADDIVTDDRRRVVNAGVRHGRDAEIANMRAIADLGVTNITSDRHCDPRGAPRPHSCPFVGPRPAARGIRHRVLSIVEIDADDRIAAGVMFDLDDIDAAFAELDARYLAGEAAAHAHTWSVIARPTPRSTGTNFPATTPDWVNVDHRRGTRSRPVT